MGTSSFVEFESYPEGVTVAIRPESVTHFIETTGAGQPRCVLSVAGEIFTVVGTFKYVKELLES